MLYSPNYPFLAKISQFFPFPKDFNTKPISRQEMDKIKIDKVSKKCFSQRGFDKKGCYGCSCKDLCCFEANVDVDKESYELILKHKDLIEPLIDKKIEECFEEGWYNEKEYLGGNMKGALNREDNYCIFHNKTGKGCVLYRLVAEKNINKRMIPTICRIFPLSWGSKELVIYDEDGEDIIPEDCNCKDPKNKTKKSILETQKEEVKDIFEIGMKKLL